MDFNFIKSSGETKTLLGADSKQKKRAAKATLKFRYILLVNQIDAFALRLRRQPMRPIMAKPEPNSGKAAGKGTAETGAVKSMFHLTASSVTCSRLANWNPAMRC
ncbi:MAG: hypothetical protein JKX91_12315 [Rhizobiaceae bacterium]|nr:hypothetical protein [Rhizobiaceae bacterium]